MPCLKLLRCGEYYQDVHLHLVLSIDSTCNKKAKHILVKYPRLMAFSLILSQTLWFIEATDAAGTA